eukprot:90176-Rhodomonas_salina.2
MDPTLTGDSPYHLILPECVLFLGEGPKKGGARLLRSCGGGAGVAIRTRQRGIPHTSVQRRTTDIRTHSSTRARLVLWALVLWYIARGTARASWCQARPSWSKRHSTNRPDLARGLGLGLGGAGASEEGDRTEGRGGL